MVYTEKSHKTPLTFVARVDRENGFCKKPSAMEAIECNFLTTR
jgi:hypothetical protein